MSYGTSPAATRAQRAVDGLDPVCPFLISPPFGSYLSHRLAYSVLGSFTADRRDRETTGESRTRRVLRTVRPVPGGWVNAIGLRNPGWNSVPHNVTRHQIVSLAPLAARDWVAIDQWLDDRRCAVEINISCPNVDEHPELPPQSVLTQIIKRGNTTIFKLPPLPIAVDIAQRLADAGARYLHLSNTLPSPIGGISGAVLREANLPLVDKIANALMRNGFYVGGNCNNYEDIQANKERYRMAGVEYHPSDGRFSVEIIAGGGIYAPEHVRAYRDAGATRFSLATAWFWPPRALRVMRSL